MSFRPASAPSMPGRLDHASLPLKLAAIGLGSLLLAIAAHVTVPFWPVPMTLQTLAVLLIGAVMGPTLALAAVGAYLLEGLCGLPVFTRLSGLAAIAGPTGGYLVGFVPAAILTGWAARRGALRTIAGAAAAFILADAVLFAFGVSWLAVSIGWSKAVAAGLVPFLAGEALKIALAVAVTRVWSRS